jgi:hypothetical protein
METPMPRLGGTALAMLLLLGGCAEGWSVSRSANASLRRHGCGNNVLDNPTLAQRAMQGGGSAGSSPMLGCSLRRGM